MVFPSSSDFVSPQLSFQEWTQPVQEMLNIKKLGDVAFRDKDFKNAIECYSEVNKTKSNGRLS